MAWTRVLVCSLLVVWAVGRAGAAAGAAVFSDTVLVKGPEYLTVLELPLDKAGSYRVTATDLEWLNTPLQALSFAVFTATKPIESRQGPGALEFFTAGKDKVFLQLYAKTLGPKFAGLVSFQVEDQTAVALPESLLLLGSALGAGALARAATWLRFHGRRARSAARSLGGPVRALLGLLRSAHSGPRGQAG